MILFLIVYCLKLSSSLNGQLIERVATEFNKLQFYVNKSRGLPLVEDIKPVSILYWQPSLYMQF